MVAPTVRAQMHLLVEQALRRHRPRGQVFSYRSAGWNYRQAYRQRQLRMWKLAVQADLSFVLRLDIHRFGRSLPLSALLSASWMNDHLAQALAELPRRTGQCLLPGHRWSNRLGTAILAPIDDLLAKLAEDRWVRWGDDWHVFVRDEGEAELIRAAAEFELQLLGLGLSAQKSGLVPTIDILAGPARDVAGNPREVWRSGRESEDIRALRFALPRVEPTDEVSEGIPDLVRNFPELLPRAVQYLDRAVSTAGGNETALNLLNDTDEDLFKAARMLALACRHAHLATSVPSNLLSRAGSCGVDGVQALAIRIAVLTTRRHLAPTPSPRMLAWLLAGADFRQDQPSVATLL